MKKTLSILLFALFSASAFAQDAQVRQLSPEEAKQAKQIYNAKQLADKQWDEFNSQIVAKYAKGMKSANVEFSSDFRFVVPGLPINANLTLAPTWRWNGQGLYYSDGNGNLTTEGNNINLNENRDDR